METVPTAEFASIVYGGDVPLDDPAEAFHEASRLYPNVAPPRIGVLTSLAASPELQQTTIRAARIHEHRPGVDLPAVRLPPRRFRDLLEDRCSAQPGVRTPLSLGDLATLLGVAYGVRPRDRLPRRPMPSGGALYPLELYALPLAVDGLGRAAFHYHPFRHRLEALWAVAETDVADALVDPSLAERSAVLLVVTAMVWRTRFNDNKRRLRNYVRRPALTTCVVAFQHDPHLDT